MAFGVAGTALEPATLHLGKTKAYDFDTDKTIETGGTDKAVSGVFYQDEQLQQQLTTNQASFMVQSADAPSGVDEEATLTFTAGLRAGQTWQVYDVKPIPTDAGYILRIRK